MSQKVHPIQELLQRDRRYKLEAYQFVREALAYAQDVLGWGEEVDEDSPNFRPAEEADGSADDVSDDVSDASDDDSDEGDEFESDDIDLEELLRQAEEAAALDADDDADEEEDDEDDGLDDDSDLDDLDDDDFEHLGDLSPDEDFIEDMQALDARIDAKNAEAPPERHLTGQQLCESIRRYALEQFGLMARVVLASWGIRCTGDFGEIVYNLIRIQMMKKSPKDRREDFDDVYSFDEAFERGFRISVPDASTWPK